MTNAPIETAPSAPPAAVPVLRPGANVPAAAAVVVRGGDLVAATVPGSQSIVDAQMRALRDAGSGGPALDLDTELGERLGPQLAFVRAALPTEARARFNAQLAANASLRQQGNGTAVATHSESDLRALVRAAQSGNQDDPRTAAALAALARYVANHGPAPVADALRFERPPAFGGAPNAPGRASERRVERRDDERQRERNRRQPPVPEMEAAPERPVERPYTIDDIVQFAGEPIAVHHTDTRTLSWPS